MVSRFGPKNKLPVFRIPRLDVLELLERTFFGENRLPKPELSPGKCWLYFPLAPQ